MLEQFGMVFGDDGVQPPVQSKPSSSRLLHGLASQILNSSKAISQPLWAACSNVTTQLVEKLFPRPSWKCLFFNLCPLALLSQHTFDKNLAQSSLYPPSRQLYKAAGSPFVLLQFFSQAFLKQSSRAPGPLPTLTVIHWNCGTPTSFLFWTTVCWRACD